MILSFHPCFEADENRLCAGTHINLAGVDILFSSEESRPVPLFLEINYFFGRQGIGGSEAYYALLVEQIHRWIADQKLR